MGSRCGAPGLRAVAHLKRLCLSALVHPPAGCFNLCLYCSTGGPKTVGFLWRPVQSQHRACPIPSRMWHGPLLQLLINHGHETRATLQVQRQIRIHWRSAGKEKRISGICGSKFSPCQDLPRIKMSQGVVLVACERTANPWAGNALVVDPGILLHVLDAI